MFAWTTIVVALAPALARTQAGDVPGGADDPEVRAALEELWSAGEASGWDAGVLVELAERHERVDTARLLGACAGRLNRSLHRRGDARLLYSAALAHVAEGEPVVRADLLTRQATVQLDLSEREAAAESLVAARRALASVSVEEKAAADVIAARAHLCEARQLAASGDRSAALSELDAALRLCGPSTDLELLRRSLLEKAKTLARLGEPSAAERCLREAQDTVVGADEGASAQLSLHWGLVRALSGDFEGALPDLFDAVRAHHLRGDRDSLAYAALTLFHVLNQLDAEARCLEVWDAIRDSAMGCENWQLRATLFDNLASVHRNRELWNEAVAFLELSGAIYRDRQDPEGMLRNASMWASLELGRGMAERAVEHFDTASSLASEHGLEEPVTSDLLRVQALLQIARWSAAAELVAVLERRSAAGELSKAQRAFVTQLRGTIRMESGDYDGAVSDVSEAARTFRALGQVAEEAGSLFALGRMHLRWGLPREALRDAQRADEVARRLALPHFRGRVQNLLGAIHLKLGDQDAAERAFAEAASRFRETGSTADLSIAVLNHALTWIGRPERGEPPQWLVDDVREARRLHGAPGDLRDARIARCEGVVLRERGLLDEAHERLTYALAIFDERELVGLAAEVRIDLGRVLNDRGDWEGALRFFVEGANALAEVADDDQMVDALLTGANVQLAAGEPRPALHRCRAAALSMTRMLHRQVESLGRASSLAYRRKSLDILDLAMGCLEAIDPAERERDDLEAVNFVVQSFKGVGMSALLVERRADSLVGGGDRDDTDVVMERWRTLAAELERRRLAIEEAERRVDENETRGQRAQRLAARRRQIAELAGLSAELEGAERSARASFPRLGELAYPQPAELNGIQRHLPEGVALVEFVATNRSLGAMRTTSDDAVFEVLATGGRDDEWWRVVDGVTEAVARGRLPDHGTLARLRSQLLDPVVGSWDDVDSLVIAPDGALCRLPFDVLVMPDGRYLAEVVEMSYVHSGTVLREMTLDRGAPAPAPRMQIVGFFDPDYCGADGRPSHPRLSSSRRLMRVLAERFDDDGRAGTTGGTSSSVDPSDECATDHALHVGDSIALHGGREASEEAFRREAATSCRVLHFDGHARADAEEPTLSRLLLTGTGRDGPKDGAVYLDELMALSLAAELVVLAACETNAGPIEALEGPVSLSRAVLAAGARSVISTLWRVPDQGTFELMADFYTQLLGEGRTRGEALTAAKRAAIARGTSPRVWAAFTLWDAPKP